jgi:hypothetical protein
LESFDRGMKIHGWQVYELAPIDARISGIIKVLLRAYVLNFARYAAGVTPTASLNVREK